MATPVERDPGFLDFFRFARRYFRGARSKLAAVLVLDVIASSITGAGLLLILPLLGLLGLGSGDGDSLLWERVRGGLRWLGLELTLESGLALLIGLVSLRALINWRRQTWRVAVEQRFQTLLRNGLYETLARTELYHLQQLRTSEFVQATQSEIRQAQQAANALFLLFAQALNLCAYSVVAMILSARMTLVALAFGALALLALLPLVKRTHELSRQQIRVRSSMINNLVEHIQGLRTARALGLTPRFVEDYRARSAQAARVVINLTRLSAFSSLAFELVAVVLMAGIVYIGLTRLELEPARFVVLLLVFIRIFPTVGEFQNRMQVFATMLPSFWHYLDLLRQLERHEEAQPDLDDSSLPPMCFSLELRNVGFAYGNPDNLALEDISLEIEKGRLTVIGGKSGAGKSTLIDVVTGLLPPQKGGVYVDGHRLSESERLLWRRQTALVPQETFLFNDTIRENLLCVKPDATAAELREVLDAANCRDFIESRDGGLDRPVGERGGLLSGGERQRISIARALLRKPQLLVLDEPTNNLDEESVSSLLEILRSLREKATLLVVSHDQRILRCADRIYRLADGRVL